MIIADTNVVSEVMRDTPDGRVLAWAESVPVASLTISVVTVEEIERGLGQLPPGRRRADLGRRWAGLLKTFEETIASYDLPAAQATARIVVSRSGQGRPISLPDAQIAGICICLGATLATRNTKDFELIPSLPLINPFDA